MERREMLRMATPLIAMGTVWAARRTFDKSYQLTTGEDAPSADDLDRPLASVLAYTIGVSVVAAVVNVAISRAMAKATQPTELTVV